MWRRQGRRAPSKVRGKVSGLGNILREIRGVTIVGFIFGC